MIKVFVFVSGLTLASLPITSDGEPIVFAFPDHYHQLSVYRAGAVGEPELVPIQNIPVNGFELELEKKCAGGCPASMFRLSELFWFPDLSLLAGAGNEARPDCAKKASVANCKRRNSSAKLLAGTMRLTGDWELEARTDCREKGFPIDVSTSGRETLVNAKKVKEPKPLATPQPYADSYRLETSLKNLVDLTPGGFPPGFKMELADPNSCLLYGDTTEPCAMLLVRFAPISAPSAGPLAEHFEHLYDLMAAAPAKSWAPYLVSGKYCDEPKHKGGGHPRCLGGYVAY